MIGATLDRNGLRPGRWLETTDGWVVLASEAGVLDIPADRILRKGRLQPGKLFLVDLEQGRIVPDSEVEGGGRGAPAVRRLVRPRARAARRPARASAGAATPASRCARLQLAFGYTQEDMKVMLAPLAVNGEEAIGSMGNDTPLAVLSGRRPLMYSYFKQLFAQVTNPPIDPIREAVVMSVQSLVGSERNLLDETPEHARQLVIDNPILRDEELERLRQVDSDVFKAHTIDFTWPVAEGVDGLEPAIERICAEADAALAAGANILIVSDRQRRAGAGRDAVAARGRCDPSSPRARRNTPAGRARGRVRRAAQRAERRGADRLRRSRRQSVPDARDDRTARRRGAARHAARGCRGAGAEGGRQGPAEDDLEDGHLGALVVLRCPGLRGGRPLARADRPALHRDRRHASAASAPASSRTGALVRHARAYPGSASELLPVVGLYAWRRDGEHHQWNPETIALLQHAVRGGGRATYKEFAALVNDDSARRSTLRGLLRFRDQEPIPLEEVEPATEIVKRFSTGAMSLGSLSREAHETLAVAMNRIGGRSNTGEGGEDPARYLDERRSKIKQVASGRFGVNIDYLTNADELQIKMAQGAKPGEGGQLPGHKVDPYIAGVRLTTPGVGLISPPPHHDIYSIEDLKQLIYDLRCANPDARISVKLVAEVGVGTVAAGVAKCNADHILISGHDGGTGASPISSILHAGVPWEIGLAETQQTLVLNDLRSRVWVQTDGQLKTGRDVVIAALLGADEMGFATAPLIATGCVMMRACHLNTCPVGIATQDPELRKRFRGQPEHVIEFLFHVAEDVRELMASLGVARFEDLVGRVDLLEPDDALTHWQERGIDLTHLLRAPDVPDGTPLRRTQAQVSPIADALDWQLIQALDDGRRRFEVRNVDRAVGGLLSHHVTKNGLSVDVAFELHGSAGQSFGAWLAPGIELTLVGDANDYVGKGLSGGVVAVRPPDGAAYRAEESVIVGNTVLYGATSGRAFFRGIAGERFAVRNSGASAVVEGLGDHGCEYMTGGRVVVIGATGRNFAAGMSGGIAYVLDDDVAVRAALQHAAGRPRRARRRRRGCGPSPATGACRAHRLAGRAGAARRLGSSPLREGDPARLQARARRARLGRRRRLLHDGDGRGRLVPLRQRQGIPGGA